MGLLQGVCSCGCLVACLRWVGLVYLCCWCLVGYWHGWWAVSVRSVVVVEWFVLVVILVGFAPLGFSYFLELCSLTLVEVGFTVVCWWVDCGCYSCFKRGFCVVFKFVGLFGLAMSVGYYLRYGGSLCLCWLFANWFVLIVGLGLRFGCLGC